jgi:hypothetical protein
MWFSQKVKISQHCFYFQESLKLVFGTHVRNCCLLKEITIIANDTYKNECLAKDMVFFSSASTMHGFYSLCIHSGIEHKEIRCLVICTYLLRTQNYFLEELW